MSGVESLFVLPCLVLLRMLFPNYDLSYRLAELCVRILFCTKLLPAFALRKNLLRRKKSGAWQSPSTATSTRRRIGTERPTARASKTLRKRKAPPCCEVAWAQHTVSSRHGPALASRCHGCTLEGCTQQPHGMRLSSAKTPLPATYRIENIL